MLPTSAQTASLVLESGSEDLRRTRRNRGTTQLDDGGPRPVAKRTARVYRVSMFVHQMRRPQIHYLVCSLFVLGIVGCRHPEPVIDSVKIEMTGHDFRWHSRYAGEDGQWGTSDDVHAAQVLHVPVTAEVEIVLKSRDYIYTLEVPQAGLKEIAVPDLTFTLQFRAHKIGRFELPGDQLCGYTHPDLMGTLVVDSQNDYRRWLASRRLAPRR